MAELTSAEIAELYQACAPGVYRRARALLGRESDAWDVVQEVFTMLVERPGEFHREARPMTYLWRVTTNACLNQLRARGVRETKQAELANPSAEPLVPEARELLHKLLHQLDHELSQVVALHFIDGLTQEEIGEVVGLSRKTVGRRLAAVRERAEALATPTPRAP